MRCGFEIVKAREIDLIGAKGVIETIKQRVGDSKVYISVDIDVLDPAFAPGKLSSNIDFVFKDSSRSKVLATNLLNQPRVHQSPVDGALVSYSPFLTVSVDFRSSEETWLR